MQVEDCVEWCSEYSLSGMAIVHWIFGPAPSHCMPVPTKFPRCYSSKAHDNIESFSCMWSYFNFSHVVISKPRRYFFHLILNQNTTPWYAEWASRSLICMSRVQDQTPAHHIDRTLLTVLACSSDGICCGMNDNLCMRAVICASPWVRLRDTASQPYHRPRRVFSPIVLDMQVSHVPKCRMFFSDTMSCFVSHVRQLTPMHLFWEGR